MYPAQVCSREIRLNLLVLLFPSIPHIYSLLEESNVLLICHPGYLLSSLSL